MKDIVLELTGTIKPNVSESLAISNWQERLRMYQDAISWYLENTDYKIVFCENSDSIPESFIDHKYNNRIELLSFYSEPIVPDRGRGYKEMEILEYVLVNSLFLKDADIAVKITGRLSLLNIVPIINRLSRKSKHRFVSSDRYRKKPGSDCRFIFCHPDFLRHLVLQKEKITCEYAFESAMEDAFISASKDGFKFYLPPLPYKVHGIAMGSLQGSIFHYDITTTQYIKAYIKHLIRLLYYSCKY